MIGYFKAILSEFKILESMAQDKAEITENDIRASNMPRWAQSVLIFLLERTGDLRYFYRLKNGAQYDYYIDIPEEKRIEAVKVFTERVHTLRDLGLTQADDEYAKLCRKILEEGSTRTDRTGTGTIGIFGYQMRFDLSKGLPLLTTKRVHTKGIIGELIWFLTGSTNNNDLKKMGVSIWDEWAKPDGDLGRIYGAQWRRWEAPAHQPINEFLSNLREVRQIDQIAKVIEQIKKTPDSRRLIVTAWNPGDIEVQSLPACHTMFQFYVQSGKLSCQLYQRSGDVFLGIPFNIASYAILTHMVAQVCGLEVGEFVHTIGDAHIYLNHIDQVKEQLKRKPMAMPRLVLNKDIKSIDDFKMEDIRVENYNPHPTIKGAVSV